MATYYKINGDILTQIANQGRRLTGHIGSLTPSSMVSLFESVEIPFGPIVKVDMNNAGVNSLGNTYYDATAHGGSFSDGCFVVSETGYLSIPADFMNRTSAWTIAFTIDGYTLDDTARYCRIARGFEDVPSIYHISYYGCFMFKLTSSRATKSTVDWYDETILTDYGNGYGLGFMIPTDEQTVFAFRNDEGFISLWINGTMVAKQTTSEYTSTYQTSSFFIGDNGTSGYDMDSMKCSMVKGWARALEDWEMELLKPDITVREVD